jgi:hypothetical protein
VPNPSDPQSLNRYSYCLNNPLKYVDPTGHKLGDPGMEDDYTPGPPADWDEYLSSYKAGNEIGYIEWHSEKYGNISIISHNEISTYYAYGQMDFLMYSGSGNQNIDKTLGILSILNSSSITSYYGTAHVSAYAAMTVYDNDPNLITLHLSSDTLFYGYFVSAVVIRGGKTIECRMELTRESVGTFIGPPAYTNNYKVNITDSIADTRVSAIYISIVPIPFVNPDISGGNNYLVSPNFTISF